MLTLQQKLSCCRLLADAKIVCGMWNVLRLVDVQKERFTDCEIHGLPILIGEDFAILSNSQCLFFKLEDERIVITGQAQLRKGTVMSACFNRGFLVLGSTGSAIDIYAHSAQHKFTHVQTLKCPQYPIQAVSFLPSGKLVAAHYKTVSTFSYVESTNAFVIDQPLQL